MTSAIAAPSNTNYKTIGNVFSQNFPITGIYIEATFFFQN